jgi:hypothetical protein
VKKPVLALVLSLCSVAPAPACGITHAVVGTHFSSFAFVTPFVPTVAVTTFVPFFVAAPAVVSTPAVTSSACTSAAVTAPATVAAPAVVATPAVVVTPFVQTAVFATPFIVRERFFGRRAVVVNAPRVAVAVGGRGRVVQRTRTVTRGR